MIALLATTLPLLTGQLRTAERVSEGGALSLGILYDARRLVLFASENAPADLRVCWQEFTTASHRSNDAAAAMSITLNTTVGR